jgi:hypothetical protein
MKKIISISVLTVLLATSAFGAYLDDRRNHHRVYKKSTKHYVNRRYVRPHRVVHRRVTHVRRPHYISLNHRVGHRVPTLRRNALRLSVGGVGYRYRNGAFYRPYRSGFRVVSAPIGAVIHTLPVGYMRVRVNDRNYYRYEDTYYERRNQGYCVVETPTVCSNSSQIDTMYRYQVGDVALNLPSGAVEVIIDGKRYYEADGQYFLKTYTNGKNAYRVVEVI